LQETLQKLIMMKVLLREPDKRADRGV